MSRIGKQTIEIPSSTEISQDDSGVLTVKGPKGQLTRFFKPVIKISIKDGNLTLTPNGSDSSTYALWGTYASHIKNMVQGVQEMFEKRLAIEGVGYKAEVRGSSLVLNVGFSHPVEVPVPEGVSVSVDSGVISVSGVDKEQVGQFSAKVRGIKPPEPYKGKGIRYEGEIVRRKEGKKSV